MTELRFLRVQAWSELVQQYTACRLTKASDRLPALSGLAAAFQSEVSSAGAYLAGHWEDHLPHSLIWYRGIGELDDRDQSPIRCPSWSWSSVDGRVHFVFDRRKEPDPVARILSFDVRRDPMNLFGETSYGRLDIAAPIIRASCFGSGRTRVSVRIWFFVDDGPHLLDGSAVFDYNDPPERFYIVILVSWRFDSKAPMTHGGILVTPTGYAEGEYRRIGAFSASRRTCEFGLPAPSRFSLV